LPAAAPSSPRTLPEPPARAAGLAPLLAIFFASGFAALLYQMVWQRLLAFFGGADVRSVTVIVSAYMAGLGFGSLAGGHLADRLSVRGRFLSFAASELAIAAFGFGSVWLYYDFLCVRLGPLGLSAALTGVVIFLTLLWPTFFMGMSLPLLARALTGSAARAGERIGVLYGWNTFGAAVGALATVWVLVRASGFRATVEWGAFLNLACAGAALLVGPRYWRAAAREDAPPPVVAEADREGSPGQARFGLPAWLTVYALSGFIALSLEILWFRLLGVLLRSNAFTFATLLALYLSGVGLGALLGGRRARRVPRPDLAFLALQSAVTLYAGLSLAGLIHGLGRYRILERVWAHLGGHDPFPVDVALRSLQRLVASGGEVAPHAWESATQLLVLYVALPAALILPPTLLMGMSFAFLQQAAQTDLRSLGRRVGWLQAANIAGSTLGAVVTGIALLHWLGSAWTLRLLVVLGGVFLALWVRARGRRLPAAVAAAAAVTGAVAALVPGPEALWSKLHGTVPARILFGEDGSGLSVMKDEVEGEDLHTLVVAHGLSQGELPYGGYHVELGALPVILHPKPEEVLVIGLGSGNTAFATGGRAETVRIDCVEIVTSQLPTLFRLARRHGYDGLEALLVDGRVRHVAGDGRAHVMRGGRWDVIEADALRPQSSYAGNLYSLEYFSLLARHLKPGGLAVSWSPTPRTRDTFLKAFPHVAVFGHTLVGSNEPIPFDVGVLRARIDDPFTRAYYRRGGVDIEAVLGPVLARGPVLYGPQYDRSRLVDLNTDLFPRDEYLASARLRP
jgi:spermidine synthase